MKLLVVPNRNSDLSSYVKNGCEGFIVGLKNFSTNYDLQLDIDEIKSLRQEYPNIEIFVSLNKNIFNEELDALEENLKELDNIDISGVLFYDLSVLYLRNKNHLKLNLVWNQTHMVTNYNTCNYYYDLGVKYGYLSGEITLEEINEIKSKTNMKLMCFGFGYPIMAHTRRSLLTNYFISHNKKYDGQICHIYDDKTRFSLKEDETGTTFLNDSFVNGSCLITDSLIDYVIFGTDLVSEDKSLKLIKLIHNLLNTKEEGYVLEIEKLIGNDTNFFFKKTIFMVKKDEK